MLCCILQLLALQLTVAQTKWNSVQQPTWHPQAQPGLSAPGQVAQNGWDQQQQQYTGQAQQGMPNQQYSGWNPHQQQQQQPHSGWDPHNQYLYGGWDPHQHLGWRQQQQPGRNMQSQPSLDNVAHSKLDSLLQTTSNKVLKAQQAGQAMKEIEHNILHYIASSANNVIGEVKMTDTVKTVEDLYRRLGHLNSVVTVGSESAQSANTATEKQSNGQIVKLGQLNEELAKLKSSLEKLAESSEATDRRRADFQVSESPTQRLRKQFEKFNMFSAIPIVNSRTMWTAFGAFEVVWAVMVYWLAFRPRSKKLHSEVLFC